MTSALEIQEKENKLVGYIVKFIELFYFPVIKKFIS